MIERQRAGVARGGHHVGEDRRRSSLIGSSAAARPSGSSVVIWSTLSDEQPLDHGQRRLVGALDGVGVDAPAGRVEGGDHVEAGVRRRRAPSRSRDRSSRPSGEAATASRRSPQSRAKQRAVRARRRGRGRSRCGCRARHRSAVCTASASPERQDHVPRHRRDTRREVGDGARIERGCVLLVVELQQRLGVQARPWRAAPHRSSSSITGSSIGAPSLSRSCSARSSAARCRRRPRPLPVVSRPSVRSCSTAKPSSRVDDEIDLDAGAERHALEDALAGEHRIAAPAAGAVPLEEGRCPLRVIDDRVGHRPRRSGGSRRCRDRRRRRAA